ncbi:hypothetical protein [Dietzia sp. NCCP-2495]|uniref:hypothetical protein n=1 Tax=Dietzia sp. NCCP-2495 TaxID=2934675 RepID=UPI00222EFC83|nr:hypothetical protein [Dietzia sp. NCCP-2495]
MIAIVVVVIDATLLATGVIGPAAALALFLAVEAPLGAAVVTGYVRRYRAHRASTDSRRDALRALAADDPYLRMITFELGTLASLGRWIARRPDVPGGAVPIGYSLGTLGMPAALAVAALIELVALHLLIPWPTVRLVLDLLGVYALLVVLGMLAGRIVRPHLLTSDELVLRSGPHGCARIPLDALAAVRLDRRLSPTNAELVSEPGREILALPGADGTRLTLALARPVAATVPGMPWSSPPAREVTEVRLHVDDDAADQLRAAVPSPAGRT